MIGSSICYYFRIGVRKMNVDDRKVREVEYRFLSCRCPDCVDGESKGLGSYASSTSVCAFSSTCKNTVNMGIRHYANMGQSKLKPVELRRAVILRRRLRNAAAATALSGRATATAVRPAAEEDLGNSAVSCGWRLMRGGGLGRLARRRV